MTPAQSQSTSRIEAPIHIGGGPGGPLGGVSIVPWTFLSEIPQLATNEGPRHDGQGCPSYGRIPPHRANNATPPTLHHQRYTIRLHHQATAAAVVAPLHPFVPPPNGSAHLSCDASGDLPDGELRAKRKPSLLLRRVGTFVKRYADRQNDAPRLQPPPRNTRLEPSASEHHSHTLPCMSYKPQPFGNFSPTA